MWDKILHRFLTHLIRQGRLTVTYPDGTNHSYGGIEPGPEATISLHDPTLPRRIVMSPDLAVGEAYVDGRLSIENDDLYGFLGVAIGNVAAQGQPWFRRPLEAARHLGRWAAQFNPASRARANVAHHYDLSGALYDLFLDTDRQYSCAYFSEPGMSLEEAQEAKKHHIAAKLLLRPGMRVLDIGCGWGGMGLTLARDYGAEVLGVTLSQEQYRIANDRARAEGLADRARFELMDYRALTGQFDRIVSVGMFEHVGVPHYREYFDKVRARLAPRGVALIHTIGRARPPGSTSPWIAKYIFPGGYVPALSEMTRAVENAGLMPTDVEIWRLHYAETLRHWHDRFMANVDAARALYDEQFCRMWRYYLIASELTFRLNRQVVFQMQLSPVQDAVPLTRDYLYQGSQTRRQAAE
ncbi:class I SAM-dependent methyltransferase [Pseudohalocynthiibacter aestuariivivens]|nr:cyclopropane-fatty-acyl-phospholipid synthase family protein [Pseudohalocynthiibacter aestuariivivens]QIE47065.1 class I SAM-dependent methyltransferase [Pseudohalocynthiibacter aestuariivivens]